MVRKTTGFVTGIGLLCLAFSAMGDIPETTRSIEIRIDAPTMVAALIQFSQQTGLQLVFPTDGTGDLAAPPVRGTFTPRAALDVLLQDSGLTYTFVNSRTISVSLAKARSAQGGLTTTASPR